MNTIIKSSAYEWLFQNDYTASLTMMVLLVIVFIAVFYSAITESDDGLSWTKVAQCVFFGGMVACGVTYLYSLKEDSKESGGISYKDL